MRLVLIQIESNKGSDESARLPRLVCAFVACIHKLGMKIKTQTKIKTSSPAGYVGKAIQGSFAHMC